MMNIARLGLQVCFGGDENFEFRRLPRWQLKALPGREGGGSPSGQMKGVKVQPSSQWQQRLSSSRTAKASARRAAGARTADRSQGEQILRDVASSCVFKHQIAVIDANRSQKHHALVLRPAGCRSVRRPASMTRLQNRNTITIH